MSPFAPQKNFGEPQATVADAKTSFVDRTKKCHAEARRSRREFGLIREAVVARDLIRFYSVSSVCSVCSVSHTISRPEMGHGTPSAAAAATKKKKKRKDRHGRTRMKHGFLDPASIRVLDQSVFFVPSVREE